MWHGSRRDFLQASSAAAVGWAASNAVTCEKPSRIPSGVEVLNPRARVPMSFIIDDSTCLVNMGHFCMPQFAEVYPSREAYQKPWKTWPREIPDAFVREFGEKAYGVFQTELRP